MPLTKHRSGDAVRRRPAATGELPESLQVRVTKKLAAKIERLREYHARSGGRIPTPSELVGEALESASLLSDPPVGWVDDPAEALATARRIGRSEGVGSRNLWVYLSHLISEAYRDTQRRYVSAHVLVDVLLSFKAVYEDYRTTRYTSVKTGAIDRLIQRNFGGPYNASVEIIVDELVVRLSTRRVESRTAALYSHNLHILLRDLAVSQADSTLTDKMRPHLPSLILVATKGLWYSNGQKPLPLSTSRQHYVQTLRAPRDALRRVQGGVTLTLNDQHEDLPWSLDLHNGRVTLSGTYPEWQDLTALFIDAAESGDFREITVGANPDGVRLWNKGHDNSVFLSPDDFHAVGTMLRQVLDDARLAHVFTILDQRFGQI